MKLLLGSLAHPNATQNGHLAALWADATVVFATLRGITLPAAMCLTASTVSATQLKMAVTFLMALMVMHHQRHIGPL
jgi:hypothetical protein